MPPLKGKGLRVKVSTVAGGAGAYNVVAGVRSAKMTRNGQTVDVSTLTDNDIVRLQGIKDAKYEISGNFEGADTNGQVAIRNALETDSEIWLQFLPDGVAGWKQQVKIAESSPETGGPDDKVSWSASIEGTGAVSTV